MPGLNINNHSLDAAHSLDGVVVVAREPWTKWDPIWDPMDGEAFVHEMPGLLSSMACTQSRTSKAPHLASSLFII